MIKLFYLLNASYSKITFSKFLFLLLFLILSQLSCNTTEPPPPPDDKKPTLTLALEDVSCTEAWLTLTTKDLDLPAELTLKQYNQTGDSLSQIFLLNTQDSLLYIDSLLPNQNYSFQVSSIENPVSPEGTSSNKLPVTTMDTTSHNFTWQTFEFGQHSSSLLYDVAIIDENNIWAVGAIYMNDSLGNPDPHAYNAVHWNGYVWELKRFYFPTFCPQTVDSGSYPANSIFVFNDGNIIVGSGSSFAIVRENMQYRKYCVPVSINKIWGSSISDFYFVGYGGGIAHATATQFGYNFTKL